MKPTVVGGAFAVTMADGNQSVESQSSVAFCQLS